MMLITDQDAVALIEFAIRYACAKLQIPEFGIIEHDELLAAIAAKDAAVHQLLTSFLVSYQAWYDFHKKMDRQEKQGQLSAAETRELTALSDRKDAAREQIVARLRSIPQP